MANPNAGQTGSCDSCGSTYTNRSGCGCGQHVPCETEEPTGCMPPTSIGSGIKVFVVDAQGCTHLLSSPGQNAILAFNATTGFIEWRTGSLSLPICLPALADGDLNADTIIARLPIVNDSGCVSMLTIDPDFTGQLYAVLTPEGIQFVPASGNIIPEGTGIVYNDGGTISLIEAPIVDGQFLTGNTDGTFAWVTLSDVNGEQVTIDSYRGLKITNFIAGVYNTTQIQGTVDVVTLADPAQNKVRFDSAAFNADITSSGAGGLDTGAVATAWYYIYVISNGTAISSLFSLSSTAPTMPSGYTYRQMVGVVRYETGLKQYFQTNNQVWININIQVTGDQSTPQASAITAIDISTMVPPIAKTWFGFYNLTNTQDLDTAFGSLAIYNTMGLSNPIQIFQVSPAITAARASISGSAVGPIPIQVSQTTYWRTASSGAPAYTVALLITGFSI